MQQEKGPLAPIEIFSSEYELEGETSIGSALFLYTLLLPIPLLPLSNTSPPFYNISQSNFLYFTI